MAKTPKKTRKSKHGYRNDMRPRSSTSAHPSAGTRSSGSSGPQLGDDSPAWSAVKTAGGALGAAIACAFIARQDWLPPKAITAGVSAVGAALAVGGHSDTLRAVGNGAMSAAGGQFGLLIIDDHYQTKQPPQQVASTAPVKKLANADSLPPGALESAYERARARLAMANAAGQMAA
jgi:hypothetical protein